MFKEKSKDKLFNALVQNASTIYLMYEPKEEKVIYITRNVEEVLGIKIDYERNLKNFVKEILSIPVLQNEMDSWDGKSELVTGMLQYRNPSYQHPRWIKVRLYPYKDKKTTNHVIVISDATTEHEHQHMLVTQAADIKAREQQLNQITSISYDVEMTLDLTTDIFKLNNLKETVAYFGDNITGTIKDMENIIKTYIFDSDAPTVYEHLNKIIEIKKDINSEKDIDPISVSYRLKDEKTTLESIAFFTKGNNGYTVTILTHDISENTEYVKRQNDLLQKALNEAETSSKAKNEFLTIMSHEIRTPMNVIIGLSESILSKDDMDKDIKEDIENINTASLNLLSVIDGLLDISKIESGKVETNELKYDTAKFIKDLEAFAKAKLKNSKVVLEMAIDPVIPSNLFGDSNKLRQILQNIINNAIQYTEEGRIIIGAKWNGDKENGKLSISISDTGIGIEKEKLDHLFDDKNDKKNYSSGMGLYIAKKYIDLLNGEIEVESEVKKGSKFTVTISQKVMNSNEIGDIYSKQTIKKDIKTFDATGKRILLVDDDNLNIKVATRLLKPYNLEIVSLNSGKEAIELLKNDNKFDLILLDQMMPEMSGTETLHNMREEKIEIPTIMLTADAMVGKKELYLKAGFNDYLSKPINTEELNNILKKYLEK